MGHGLVENFTESTGAGTTILNRPAEYCHALKARCTHRNIASLVIQGALLQIRTALAGVNTFEHPWHRWWTRLGAIETSQIVSGQYQTCMKLNIQVEPLLWICFCFSRANKGNSELFCVKWSRFSYGHTCSAAPIQLSITGLKGKIKWT